MHHGQDKMDHVLGRNGPRVILEYHQFCEKGGEEGVYLHEIDMFTTIPVSAVFFLFSIGGKKVYEPFSLSLSLSLSHTQTHKCNLSYFLYIPIMSD